MVFDGGTWHRRAAATLSLIHQLDAGLLRERQPLGDVGIDEGAKAAGEFGSGSAPSWASFCRDCGSSSTVLVSVLILSTMLRGVPAGANSPNQPSEA